MLVLGFAVYLTRIAGIALIPAERLPPRFERALRYLPVAILASLVAVNLMPSAGVSHREYVAMLIATVVTAAVAYRLKQPLLALIAGAGTLSIARFLGLV
jgi:branched-subunit amino acid transport protein